MTETSVAIEVCECCWQVFMPSSLSSVLAEEKNLLISAVNQFALNAHSCFAAGDDDCDDDGDDGGNGDTGHVGGDW